MSNWIGAICWTGAECLWQFSLSDFIPVLKKKKTDKSKLVYTTQQSCVLVQDSLNADFGAFPLIGRQQQRTSCIYSSHFIGPLKGSTLFVKHGARINKKGKYLYAVPVWVPNTFWKLKRFFIFCLPGKILLNQWAWEQMGRWHQWKKLYMVHGCPSQRTPIRTKSSCVLFYFCFWYLFILLISQNILSLRSKNKVYTFFFSVTFSPNYCPLHL